MNAGDFWQISITDLSDLWGAEMDPTMRVYCSGNGCQKNPENAKTIVITNCNDSRLNLSGMYVCEQCKKQELKE